MPLLPTFFVFCALLLKLIRADGDMISAPSSAAAGTAAHIKRITAIIRLKKRFISPMVILPSAFPPVF